jgi:hydroxymethylglutaryl-CoA synthase
MFSLRVGKDISPGSPLRRILASVEDVPSRLAARCEVLPQDFVETLEIREKVYHANTYTPICSLQNLFPGSYYLENIDKMFRRTYLRKPKVDSSDLLR